MPLMLLSITIQLLIAAKNDIGLFAMWHYTWPYMWITSSI